MRTLAFTVLIIAVLTAFGSILNSNNPTGGLAIACLIFLGAIIIGAATKRKTR